MGRHYLCGLARVMAGNVKPQVRMQEPVGLVKGTEHRVLIRRGPL